VATNDGVRPVVLVVDDEEDIADTYALHLQERYETRVAYSGEEALGLVDDGVDAVLLDRRMPDIHGDDVLAEIRDRGHDCIVIMSTAVDPDLNILEMDFDDYLCKPILREPLLDALDTHLDRSRYGNDEMEEFLSIVSKIDVLQQELSPAELADSDEYQRLKNRAEKLAPRLRETVDDFEAMVETYREISRG